MTTVKVSIIIPVYNAENYLKDCLNSILGQSLKEIEVICVNDGSTDGSLTILKEYESADVRVRVFSQENGGPSNARNTGLNQAVGDFIYFCDSDDYLDKEALSFLYEKAEKEHLDLLFFSAKAVYENQALEQRIPMSESFIRNQALSVTVTGEEMFRLMVKEQKYTCVVWGYLSRRSHIETHHLRFYPNMLCGEDQIFTFQNLLLAETVSSVTHDFYHRRVREESITTTVQTQRHIEGNVTALMKMLLFYKTQPHTKELSVYQCYFQRQRGILGRSYEKITGGQRAKAEETLANLESLLLGKPLIKILSLEELALERTDYKNLIFFGAGVVGERALLTFKTKNIAPPVAICDNGEKVQGTTISGVPVISFHEALETYDNPKFVITNSRYYQEIFMQVAQELGEESILNIII